MAAKAAHVRFNLLPDGSINVLSGLQSNSRYCRPDKQSVIRRYLPDRTHFNGIYHFFTDEK
ncbi:hypothetical protein C3432_03350 [Citrobacter amalonaticus]|uniref:Uncharacterized protein n=1 Tax=Citrobacter amalonaticus TaxID=35703 RepID=A0A2S4S394_CITAM|nr:hypothetical protein C3432_03350 [Citrobacter amalonaticus]POT77893.1 hypothetical protein C3436_11020 [Citrobacter amalonaticus]POU68345.1 hypothetical protein C3430_04555 [Citrobacter amalonaticus]POV07948.1 hypothetical protein C3424_04565 [Citrobacter amalonaticus]